MGIPHLTRHLLPYAKDVLLAGEKQREGDDSIQLVVIDGPSLVYHVFQRLLSNSNTKLEVLDAQPTCDEVSLGVMVYLLQLKLLGVKVTKICFDGALPITKRKIRLCRLEKSRKKLEQFHLQNRLGFAKPDDSIRSTVDPTKVLQSRVIPIRYNGLPENPFMVSTVFEDLRKRWNKANILMAVQDAFYFNHCEIGEQDFPWAAITVMVPGEADAECARMSRLTGAAVLTNDSDLLLHDLGSYGSVLFLDSVELSEWDPSRPTDSKVKARRLCPASLSRRLGIRSVRYFAYELSQNPQFGLSELIRRSRENCDFLDLAPDYQHFLEDYDYEPNSRAIAQHPQDLDPRISEIFLQYDTGNACFTGSSPHMYLAILSEDHSRRCAWEEGRSYRALGYSVFNLCRPFTERYHFVEEYVRRGGRIAIDRIAMGDEGWITSEVHSFHTSLSSAQVAFGKKLSSSCFWRLFAMCELFRDETNHTAPDVNRLCRFLRFGYMGEAVSWADVHLCAQIHAVLYSLRILKQLLGLVTVTEEPVLRLKSEIAALPPLHVMMRPRREMTREYPEDSSVEKALQRFFLLSGQHVQSDDEMQPPYFSPEGSALQHQGSPKSNCVKHVHRSKSNLYEILSPE